MVEIAIVDLKSDQFSVFSKNHKKFIGCAIDGKETYSYITIEFRCYSEKER